MSYDLPKALADLDKQVQAVISAAQTHRRLVELSLKPAVEAALENASFCRINRLLVDLDVLGGSAM